MSPEVVREQPMGKFGSEDTRQKERLGCLVCLRNNGEASAAGMEWGGWRIRQKMRLARLPSLTGQHGRPRKDFGFYSEPDEKPPERLSGGGSGSD